MFTLAAGLLFAIVVMAADRRPMVTVTSSKNYKIVVNGRTYFSNDPTISIRHLNEGRHFIKVFEMRRGYFGQRELLVGSSSFFLHNRDVMIHIDRFGNISIRETKKHKRHGRGGWDDDDDDYYDRRDNRRNRF